MADELVNKIKKERKKNFSAKEIEILVEEVTRIERSCLPLTKMSTQIKRKTNVGRTFFPCMYLTENVSRFILYCNCLSIWIMFDFSDFISYTNSLFAFLCYKRGYIVKGISDLLLDLHEHVKVRNMG